LQMVRRRASLKNSTNWVGCRKVDRQLPNYN